MNPAFSFSNNETRVEIVPLEEGIHRNQFFDLNVEFLSWVDAEMMDPHDIDITPIMGITVCEYVGSVIDELFAVYSLQ